MLKIYKRLGSAAASLLLATAVFGQSSDAAGDTPFSMLPRTAAYSLSSEVLGVQMGGELTVETTDAGDDWEITESVRFPGGIIISDTAFVDKKTLALKRGISREPEKTIEYEISGGKLNGTETVGKKVKKFALDAGADSEIFNTRAFSFALYTRLPLEKSYAARLRIFNPARKKIEEIDFRVAREEQIFIEGNRFDCYRVEVAATEDRKGSYTVWINRKTRRIIRLKGQTFGGWVRGTVELQTAAPPRVKL